MKKFLDYIIWEYERCLLLSKQNFEDFIGFSLEISDSNQLPESSENRLFHHINFNGGLNGRIHVNMQKKFILQIAEKLMGDISAMSEEEALSIQGELCNIIAGNVIGNLANKIDGRIDLTIPYSAQNPSWDLPKALCYKIKVCKFEALQLDFVLLVEFYSIGDLTLIQNMIP